VTQIPDSISETGMLKRQIGNPKAHAGYSIELLCLKNTGSLKTVIVSSIIALIMKFVRPKNSAPQKFAAPFFCPAFLPVFEKAVNAIMAMIVIWIILKMETIELRFIRSHSLEKHALKSSQLETPYFSLTKASG
jgi:hypothetical protein